MYTINLYILSSMSFLIDRCDLRVVTRERMEFVTIKSRARARERENGINCLCVHAGANERERKARE